MIKLYDLLIESLLNEVSFGIGLDDNNKIQLNNTFTDNDIYRFEEGGLKKTIKGNDIYYNLKIAPNVTREKAAEFSEKLKNFDFVGNNKNIVKNFLLNHLKTGILNTLENINEVPTSVYALESSSDLSKFVAGLLIRGVREKYGVVIENKGTIPKKRFAEPEDMIDSVEFDRLESKEMQNQVLNIAQKVWDSNEGKIKSSKIIPPKFRKYFKSKYDIEQILQDKTPFIIDDNVQTGTDFNLIKSKFGDDSNPIFYALYEYPTQEITPQNTRTKAVANFDLKLPSNSKTRSILNQKPNKTFILDKSGRVNLIADLKRTNIKPSENFIKDLVDSKLIKNIPPTKIGTEFVIYPIVPKNGEKISSISPKNKEKINISDLIKAKDYSPKLKDY